MTKEEMERKFEEIFEFAELREVHGMYARLVFPTADFPLTKIAGDKFEVGGCVTYMSHTGNQD